MYYEQVPIPVHRYSLVLLNAVMVCQAFRLFAAASIRCSDMVALLLSYDMLTPSPNGTLAVSVRLYSQAVMLSSGLGTFFTVPILVIVAGMDALGDCVPRFGMTPFLLPSAADNWLTAPRILYHGRWFDS